MQILWNGQCSSRGIRQGDLFSPYIFVLCIERQLPGLTVWSKAVVGSPFTFLAEVFPSPISSFLEDLLLFAEASCDQATVIHEVLYSFCDISDENVNNKKTQFFFSYNVKSADVNRIGPTLGFSITKDLGKYLGMPILHSRVNKATYQGILERAENCLSGWSAKLLFLAGRITLTQSMIQALPIYSMQTIRLPTNINKKIEKVCRKFIWCGASESKKLHLVNGANLCQPKEYGGLGFKDLQLMNDAQLMKLVGYFDFSKQFLGSSGLF